MFKEWMERRRSDRATRQFFSSPLGETFVRYNTDFFAERPGLNEEMREDYARELLDGLQRIADAENEFLAFRQEIALVGVDLAECQVLTSRDDVLAQQGNTVPYISGLLHGHIADCVEHNEFLKKLCADNSERMFSDAELIQMVEFRLLRCGYLCNGLNAIRVLVDDFSTEPDWLLPYVLAMQIWHESVYRDNLGLPTLFPPDNPSLYSLSYSYYFDKVRQGEKNPHAAFEESWTAIGEGEPHYLIS